MFLPKDDVKQKVKGIIMDESDNDIVFIVANKGIGKLSLLEEIYDLNSFDKNIIITNGKRVHIDGSGIKKCYIDGICLFLERNNPKDFISRDIYRHSLIKILKEKNVLPFSYRVSLPFYFKRQIDVPQMIEWLSKPTVSISTLKSIYVAVAQKTPLIIFTEAMRFSIIDRRYLLNLKTDTWDARITYIIAAGVSEKDIQFIQSVTDEKESGTWVFPLLPDIIKPAGTTVNSLAEISLVDIGQSSHYDKFIEKILSGNIYCKMYDLVQSLISRGFEPQHIFFLADQEISLHHYAYLCKVINVLYHKDSHLDQHFILSHEGKLLWLDALSYYITLHDGMDKAVAATQLFFFDIFNNIQNFIYEKPERNKLVVFLKKSANKVSNPLADGFSLYFSDMAALVYHSATNDKFSRCTYEQSFAIVDILDKAGIQFSESSIQALTSLHTYTQLCFILDIGLEAISSYFKSIGSRKDIPCSTVNTISTFQTLCMEEAYKWNDVTLLKKIVELQLNIIASGNCIKIKFNQLTGNEEKDFLYQTLLGILKTKKLEVKDIIMRNTFFFHMHTKTNR